MRSRSMTGVASCRTDPGSAAWMPSACSAQVREPTATRVGAVPSRVVTEGVLGLVPGEHVQSQGAGRGGSDHRLLQPGHHQQRLAAARDDERRQPLHGVRVVAAQVAQVRTGREDEEVDAELGGHGAGGVHPVDGHRRGRGRGDGSHVGRLSS
jgi:hypothetical protein